MANSFSFNAVDLSVYGLTLAHSNIPGLAQENRSQLIQDLSYSFLPKRPPKPINIDVDVTAATRALLDDYLDSIKFQVTSEVSKVLKLDHITDRYWNTKLDSFIGSYTSPYHWSGTITFKADDSMAYDNTEDDNTHNIDASPKSIMEAVEGTGTVLPVWTLRAKEALGTPTIKLENVSIDEEFQWTGTFTTDDKLEIDVANWLVKKNENSTTGMAGVVAGSKFPRLSANMNNTIKVTGLWTAVTGTLQIVYRNRYL